MSANENGIVFGSTGEGYVPRQLADIQRPINEDLAVIADPETEEKPFQNATDDTILQQIVAIFAEAVAKVENAASVAFLMRDPLSALGAPLHSLVQLNGILWKMGSPTIQVLVVGGTPSTLIPAGSLAGAEDGSVSFAINEDVVIPASGSARAVGVATEDGPFNPAAGTVNVMQTPIPGWESVINTATMSVGTDEETDEELRQRQQLSTGATSYRQIGAIRAAINNIPGVTFVRCYQNSKLVADERGIPGKCLAAVVVGGDDEEIASAILLREAIGLDYHGNTSVTFVDDFGISTAVQFTRPVERLIYVRMNLEIVVDENVQKFPQNGDQLIREAIVAFSKKGHSQCEPLGNDAFNAGQDIIRSYLADPINSIGGVKIHSIQLRVDDGPYRDEDVEIPWNEIGLFSDDRIEINYP